MNDTMNETFEFKGIEIQPLSYGTKANIMSPLSQGARIETEYEYG